MLIGFPDWEFWAKVDPKVAIFGEKSGNLGKDCEKVISTSFYQYNEHFGQISLRKNDFWRN